MKKIALFICMACVALSMSAQTITGTSQITFRTAGVEDVNLMFVLSNNFSDGWDNTWDAHPAQDGGMYVYYENAKYSIWASNQYSQNLALGFKATSNTTYRLLFDAFSGVSYTITDLVANHVIAVGASITVDEVAASYYEFEIDNSLKNTAINDRFVINYVPAPVYSVTTNIDGWASYSSDVDLVAPDGLTVYAGTIVDEELILSSVNYIKANEGVIVKGGAGLTYTLTPGSGSSSYTNDLKPSSAWASHSGTIYCLHNEGVGTTAFYRYIGSDMPANKAYLQISATPSSAPKRISMRFNQPTAIENVELEAVKAEKFIENGQVLIKRGENVYNVQGQIVK